MKTLFLFPAMIWLLLNVMSVSAQENHVRALRPLEQCTLVTDMSDRIESVEWFPLRFPDGSALEYLRKMLVLPDGRFLIHHQKDVACFDAKGKYLFSMGQASTPEEGCGLIHDICMSVDQKYMYMAGRDDVVLCFDLKDGKLVKKIFLKDSERVYNYYDIAPSAEGGFFLYTPYENDKEGVVEGQKMLVQFDSTGQEVGRFIMRPDYVLPGFMISQACGNQYFVRVQGGDNAGYRVKDGILQKYCTIDFGTKGIPALYMYTNEQGGNIQSYMRADYFKMPIFFSETAGYFYFCVCGPKAKEYYFLYPRGEEKGIYWEGDQNGMVIRFWASDDEYFYAITEYGLQDYDVRTVDPLLREIMARIGLVSKEKLKGSQFLKIKFKD